MKNKTHWTDYIPEAGRMITNRANLIKEGYDKIASLTRDIQILEASMDRYEKELNDLVATQWSEQEINEAKNTHIAEAITNPN